MSSKISALTAIASVTSNDYLVVARATESANYKLLASNLFSSLVNIGHTTPVYLIDSISSTNAISQRGLKSASDILTLSVDISGTDKNISFDIDESQIDLANCDNTSSLFLTSVDLSAASGVLSVVNGGTGLSTLTDKSVLITQDSGSAALTAAPMTDNGSLLIGGTSGPAVGTLTAGTNVSITNADNSITIGSTFSTATTNVNMAGFNIDMDSGWISDDGTDGGLGFDADAIYVGTASNKFFSKSLNLDSGLALLGNKAQTIEVLDSANPGTFTISGGSNSTSGGNGGVLRIESGAGNGSGNGGDMYIVAGDSDTGKGGYVYLNTYASGAEVTGLTVDTAANVTVNNGNLVLAETGKYISHPYDTVEQSTSLSTGVTINEASGKITLAGASLAAGAQAQFTVTNSTVNVNSRILLTMESVGEALEPDNSLVIPQLFDLQNGSFKIVVSNIGSANTDSRNKTIHFLVIN